MLKYPINVTIDTNILDAAKYDLSANSTLSLLSRYVQKGKIKVVLSDIVIRESRKHIADQVSKVCGIARKLRADALDVSTEHLINYVGLNRIIELVTDKKNLIKKGEDLFEQFIQELDVEILGSDLIKIDQIIDDYFEINPPFQEGEKKRKEFPDAFIACQIRERFGKDEVVAIVSNDKGFKKACQPTPNHLFFDSLGQLYDKINKEEAAYSETLSLIEELNTSISSAVMEYVKENESIDVRGLSYDKDGVVTGFDYSEFFLHSISNTTVRVHSVDELADQSSIVTLLCEADISVNCFYEDYDNAPWDPEEKDYVFVETVEMREDHNARFGCRVELDRKVKTFKLLPFTVILGGDSRNDRYRVEKWPDIDYEQEIKDMDRESLGFTPLGSYESYLEEDLPESKMSADIVAQFEEMNNLYLSFGNLIDSFDSLLDALDDVDTAKLIIKLVANDLGNYSDFPIVSDTENISLDDISEIKKWVENKRDKAIEISGINSLPDVIKYGESIVINGVDGSERVLLIEELMISPTEGSEEIIDISLMKNQETVASGYIKLTVGYVSFDEDGGVADGIEESIDYEYLEVYEAIMDYVSVQQQVYQAETEFIKIIVNVLSTITQ